MLWLTIIVFIAMLLILVLVHEAGHLIAAKLAGCTVEEFGFGFPPRLFSRMWGGTRYSLNLVPLGGFVKIQGENMDDIQPAATSFSSKSAAWRTFILSAGVFMNVVLAYVLLTIQSGVGAPVLVTETNTTQLTDHKTYILDVAPNSPAQQAGLHEFDRVVRIAGIANPTIEEVKHAIDQQLGQKISLEIDRAGKKVTASVLAREHPPTGEGALGVSLAATGLQKVPWWQTPWAGLKRTWELLVAIATQFMAATQRLVLTHTLGETFTGPVGIVVYTNEATQLGLSYLLEFTALISLNLAIVNILPIPALDGGRILFIGLEKIVGRKRLTAVESHAHTIGFALLIALMIFITLHDVQKYF